MLWNILHIIYENSQGNKQESNRELPVFLSYHSDRDFLQGNNVYDVSAHTMVPSLIGLIFKIASGGTRWSSTIPQRYLIITYNLS